MGIFWRCVFIKKVISKQLTKIDKKERKILAQKKNKFYEEKVSPIAEKLEEKIPQKLKDTLDAAFYSGFKLVLSKGTKYIEKLYDKDKIQLEHDIKNYAVEKAGTKKSIKNLDSLSKKSSLINTGISTLEGGGLGLLGIGLPDIPIFITMIIKTIYEISLSYGFNYEKEEEQIYVLNLICGALTTGAEQQEYNEKLERLSSNIDGGGAVIYDLEAEVKQASKVLSKSMVNSKFIQGLPIVGVVGSVANFKVINKISKFSKLKYKKRYLKLKS